MYYYADELGADVKYQLGFKTDEATVVQIIDRLDLQQAEPEMWVGLATEFSWWDELALDGLTPYRKTNQDEDYYWFLWYNPETQRVYYLEFSV